MPKINQQEYEVLKSLGYKWEWLARDKRGNLLFAHRLKPIKKKNGWFNVSSEYEILFTRYFRFIKWKDNEPHSITELIEQYESEEN